MVTKVCYSKSVMRQTACLVVYPAKVENFASCFVFVCGICFAIITKTCLFKYTESFTTKNENFQTKNSDILNISAQNIDCGYALEPPRQKYEKF